MALAHGIIDYVISHEKPEGPSHCEATRDLQRHCIVTPWGSRRMSHNRAIDG